MEGSCEFIEYAVRDSLEALQIRDRMGGLTIPALKISSLRKAQQSLTPERILWHDLRTEK
jgi:hypothetical protein